jgi:uncharacterized protein (TIGR01777 family)
MTTGTTTAVSIPDITVGLTVAVVEEIRMKKVAIAGANGFIGKALQEDFRHTVILHRDDTVEMLREKLIDVDMVINLAGAPIVKRWSEDYKKTLVQSRIETTAKLVEAMDGSDVAYFISASAIGIYPNDAKCDERCDMFGEDFLSTLCREWEAEALKCSKPTAILRLGVVLGKGGALSKMFVPFKLGLGGIIGDGKMMTSWISLDDLKRIFHFLYEHKAQGIFNAVSPHPVSNKIFTQALGKALHRPTILPLPIWVLKIIYDEAASVLIDSKEIYPQRLIEMGFVFHQPNIEEALEKIVHESI